MAFVEITDELRGKVAMMRRLGVSELETSSGHVRRVVLGVAPDGDDNENCDEPAPPTPPTPDDTEERAKIAAVKIARRTYGAGR